ncbi:MAG: primase protein [Candidatus Nomurabacteria bacterium GW2011_GWA1_46_11]|uniref:DNA primase n=2 Tax=Parcubacteria group TaxID=1794811 RepID=A0A1G1YV10_9BACT|nr:MAG: primase protein [Parcubacteria group bacterium GW2011_GWA2_46_10]KKU22141.1 MAG: primase protein [Candidatus Nomurabacteria bacterium GW2011_GWA1_46_11]OGY56213.1 MAG: DNA primase [Candidatus Colwellbacteria bacterium GWA2_46_10]
MTPVEQIKDKLNLVEFLKGYLELKPAGKNQRALCPFHKEKTPSFMVSPERQMWRCFGCGEGGDIFKFVMRYENLEFYEALRVLAEKAGVDLKRTSSADQRQLNNLYELIATAKDLFQEHLKGSKEAIAYLKERHLTGQTAKEFELGFSPDLPDAVTVGLMNKGFRIEDIVRAGLTIKTEKGKYLDRFRGRIMFPIHNHFGKPVGFTGRVLPGADDRFGKYVNTPETPLFNKSRVLYGLWKSKKPVREAKKALLVEGQMDFLQLWQNGITNVVATSGTALTRDHLRALGRVAEEVVVAFDKDEAGLKAAERAIDMAGAEDFSVLVMDLGDYKDPADAAEADPEFVKKAIAEARPAMEHYLAYYLPATVTSAKDKKMAVRSVLGKIAVLPSGVERSHWLRELSYRVATPEKDLVSEMEALQSGVEIQETASSTPAEHRKLTRQDVICEEIIYIASSREDLREKIESHTNLMPELYRDVFAALQGKAEPMGEVKEMLEFLSLHPGVEMRGVGDLEAKELERLFQELELEHLDLITKKLKGEILVAERAGEQKVLDGKLKEFDDISRKMQHIKHAKSNS